VTPRLLIVGNAGGTNVGASLLRAAQRQGLVAELLDAAAAFAGPAWRRRLNWHLLGHRPPCLREYGRSLLEAARRLRATTLISTGQCPLEADVLRQLGAAGVTRLHYSTDDPWNPTARGAWFLRTLPLYDRVFTTRRANLDDLAAFGCRAPLYLPFGYDESLFFYEPPPAERRAALAAPVLFVGGADADRVPLIAALSGSGVRVALYGSYWERDARTRALTRGRADPATLRHATLAADVNLCLVRRANRDGHVMRSYEIPAIGGCMLVEDTAEHRALFGDDGDCVRYFRDAADLPERTAALLAQPQERARLAQAAHARITRGGNTYRERLATMLAAGAAS
jgi:hypothetical protein